MKNQKLQKVIPMVEIIKESNDDLNKNLFLKELSKVSDGVTLQITRISDAITSKRRNKNEDFIYIDFLILGDLIGKFVLNDDGTVKDESINVNGEIIAVPFTLNEADEFGNYTISKGKNLWNILNYGMKEKKMIPARNNSSIRCNYDEIAYALHDLNFNAIAKLVKSKDFNDYYRLEVNEKGE